MIRSCGCGFPACGTRDKFGPCHQHFATRRGENVSSLGSALPPALMLSYPTADHLEIIDSVCWIPSSMLVACIGGKYLSYGCKTHIWCANVEKSRRELRVHLTSSQMPSHAHTGPVLLPFTPREFLLWELNLYHWDLNIIYQFIYLSIHVPTYLPIHLYVSFVSRSLAFSLCHHLYAKSYSKLQYRLWDTTGNWQPTYHPLPCRIRVQSIKE